VKRWLTLPLVLLTLPGVGQEVGNWDPPAIEVNPNHDD